MRWAILVNRVLLTLLSVSTGLVKLARMPEEMEIFRAAGLPDAATIGFGVVQLVGGLLLIPNRTHAIGAGVMIPTFVFATGVLVVNGLWPFAVFSLLFPASAAFAWWTAPRTAAPG